MQAKTKISPDDLVYNIFVPILYLSIIILSFGGTLLIFYKILKQTSSSFTWSIIASLLISYGASLVLFLIFKSRKKLLMNTVIGSFAAILLINLAYAAIVYLLPNRYSPTYFITKDWYSTDQNSILEIQQINAGIILAANFVLFIINYITIKLLTRKINTTE